MLDIAYTMHCGNNPGQQDALWAGAEVFQSRNLPVAGHAVESGHVVLAVADGVANSPFPQRASRLVLEAVAAEIAGGAVLDGRLVRHVHGHLCDQLAKGRTFGASATLAVVTVQGDRCEALNVGDSRVYRITHTGAWTQLSRDHTILNAMIERGEAQAGKEYASFYHMLDACLVADDEETDFAVHRQTSPFLPGDALLLCTDGVHDTLGDALLEHLFDAALPASAQVKVWREAVLKQGAPDNFSMVMVRLTN